MSDPIIDEQLESRSMLVYGVEAMKKMKASTICISGVGGIGIEIAKNIALAGVRSLTIHDADTVTTLDTATNFYATPQSIGENRASVVAPSIADLNGAVALATATHTEWTPDLVASFSTIVLCDAPLSKAVELNRMCRDAGVGFVYASVRGVYGAAFVDLGPAFAVTDVDGEPIKEVLLSSISPDGLCTTLDNARHQLETDDEVELSEVPGAAELNGRRFRVQVKSPSTFALVDPGAFSTYEGPGGLAKSVKQTVTFSFEPLEAQLESPSFVFTDFGKLDAPPSLLAAFRALGDSLPEPWDAAAADEVVQRAVALNTDVDQELVRRVAYTARGAFVGLTGFLGGVVAQEVLKAVSGKFSPLRQWLMVDADELVPRADDPSTVCTLTGDRYDGLRICLGDKVLETLQSKSLFMVGAGAIGCEMLKNFALLGIRNVAVTDPDHIERSNLNRQFLFRNADIGQPKSQRAAAAAMRMNGDVHVDARLDLIGVSTEDKYTDAFFQATDIVVNALDNVEARLYVDQRCVANQRPLLESGTMGTKGHVQTIVPHLTESYGSRRDPPEQDVPFCTLKSFPSKFEHTVEWARDFAFGGLFVAKPEQYNKLLLEPELDAKLASADGGGLDPKLVRVASRLLARRPRSFDDCLIFARQKFESYYRKAALQLLHNFPLDHVVDEATGARFWAAPKRPPTPVAFDWSDPVHRSFVMSLAMLRAEVFGIAVPEGAEALAESVVSSAPVPEFVPKQKTIVTDEAASKEQVTEAEDGDAGEEGTSFDQEFAGWRKAVATALGSDDGAARQPLTVLDFEKDDDGNHHVDFIAAAAQLRARMYSIPEKDRFSVKALAGRIIPAIATTTSAVSGLVTVELVKVARGDDVIDGYKNSFLNLALPLFAMSEPAAAEKKEVAPGLFVSLWTSWEIRSPSTLQAFIDHYKAVHNLSVAGITQGAKMIYMAFMPMHKKRLPKQLKDLCKVAADATYVDLTVSFKNAEGKDVAGPPVRVHFA